MKILVTGSSGFVGSAVCEKLLQDHIVYGIDNYSKYGLVVRSHDNLPNYYFTFGDCTNFDTMLYLLNKVDLVIHSAASIGGIEYWNNHSLTMLIENEKITTTLFSAWLASLTKPKMIIMSSSQVYENSSIFPSIEEHTNSIIPPTSAYGLQKLLLEKYTVEAGRLHDLKYTILRPFNAYGVGELNLKSGNHVIIELINKIKNSNTIEIFGSGEQVRSFTYIDDVVDAVVCCINDEKSTNQIYNVCGNEITNINTLIKIISLQLNKSISIKNIPAPLKDVQFRQGSSKKLQESLNWHPKFFLEKGIKNILNYV
jgi:UDP-glucose 4-epimerase